MYIYITVSVLKRLSSDVILISAWIHSTSHTAVVNLNSLQHPLPDFSTGAALVEISGHVHLNKFRVTAKESCANHIWVEIQTDPLPQARSALTPRGPDPISPSHPSVRDGPDLAQRVPGIGWRGFRDA